MFTRTPGKEEISNACQQADRWRARTVGLLPGNEVLMEVIEGRFVCAEDAPKLRKV